jgi:hypothetical protein
VRFANNGEKRVLLVAMTIFVRVIGFNNLILNVIIKLGLKVSVEESRFISVPILSFSLCIISFWVFFMVQRRGGGMRESSLVLLIHHARWILEKQERKEERKKKNKKERKEEKEKAMNKSLIRASPHGLTSIFKKK